MPLKSRPLSLVLGTVLLAGSLAACGGSPAGAGSGDGLTAAVAFYPFEFVVERVGGDLVETQNLTTPGAEPHDLELTPRQVALLSTADLVVFQSGFQPAIDTAIAQAAPQRVVDAAEYVTFIPADDGDDDAEGEEHAAEAGANDPHTWLDPTNLTAVARQVQAELAEARPEAAAELTANTDALVADLEALDNEFRTGLATCALRTFITSHAAFGYLAHRYDLEQVGIRGLEPDAEPSAARIAEVQQIATREGVTTIFFETLVSPVVAQSVARDLGLATDVLDPLEGLTDASRGSDYLEVMRANLAALQKANTCT